MDLERVTLWHCNPCQSFTLVPGTPYSQPQPVCGKCNQIMNDYNEYKKLNSKIERQKDETSRGFTFKEAISTEG